MEDIKLLMTIPGIGSLLATIICAEIVNINRFKSCKAFASYTGLVPTIKVSGDPIYRRDNQNRLQAIEVCSGGGGDQGTW